MNLVAEKPLSIKAKHGSKRPRLGFLGVGWIGRNRLEAIAKSGVAEITAIADASKGFAEEAAESVKSNDTQLCTTLEELLDQELDGIVIATPSAFHAEQSTRALNRGLAVFCQKPLARTAAETRAVIDAARINNRLLGIDLSYRFLNGMQQIRHLLRQQELGKVYAIELTFHNAYGPDKSWFYDPALSGGGCVIDLGIHLVDLALWALDFPQVTHVNSSLFAKGGPLEKRNLVEDYASAQLVLDSGTSVQLSCSWRLPAGCDAVISAGFYGTEGGAVLKNIVGSFYHFTTDLCRGTKRELLSSPPEDWGGRAVVDWTRKLAAGERFNAETEHLIAVAETLDRIYDRAN